MDNHSDIAKIMIELGTINDEAYAKLVKKHDIYITALDVCIKTTQAKIDACNDWHRARIEFQEASKIYRDAIDKVNKSTRAIENKMGWDNMFN